jgi:Putative MetA-pathway of phenol degradation
MKTYLTILLSVLFFSVFAQETELVELVGDRPDQTESAFIIPKGYFQFEDGFLYENETSETQNISYSSMLLRYGLFKNFELRFATEYGMIKSTGLDDIKGFSPFTIGAKIHVNEENGWVPQIAFLTHINIAKTGAKDFLQDYHSTQMAMTFNHTINKSWSVGYSIGVEFLPDVNYSVGTYTFVSGFSISEKIGAFIEAYGDFSKYAYADNKINGGVTFLVLPNLQFDVAGGFGLSQYSANSYFGLGLIYLFKI